MMTTLARLFGIAVIALGLLALPQDSEAAAGDTPETALPFKAEQSGALPGGLNGHFAYYTFVYPGGWPIDIDLRPATEDRFMLKYIGYKVYGPEAGHEYVEAHASEDVNMNWSGAKQLFSGDAGTYVIQVYNYYPDPNATIGYTLVGNNIPPQPGEGEAGAAPVGPEPGSAGHVAIPIEKVMTGSLAAQSGGAFRYYKFSSGREKNVTINLQVGSNDRTVLSKAGFKVYGPERGKEYLQSEVDTSKTPNEKATLWITQDGEYVVQIYNYNPQASIDYQLWITR